MRFLPVPTRVDILGRRVQCTSRPLAAVGRIPQMFGPASAYPTVGSHSRPSTFSPYSVEEELAWTRSKSS